MTELLNYDPTDPNAPEFTEDEQNSLEVAEKLGQEESELLAGKYRNAEELENAYLELQKKLGSDDEAEVDTLDNDETEEEFQEKTTDDVQTLLRSPKQKGIAHYKIFTSQYDKIETPQDLEKDEEIAKLRKNLDLQLVNSMMNLYGYDHTHFYFNKPISNFVVEVGTPIMHMAAMERVR